MQTTQTWKIGNCLDLLPDIPSESIDLIVTSPPYKDEDGYSEYLIKNVAEQSYRILKNNKLCFINFGHLCGQKDRPFEIPRYFINAGFNFVDTIVWVKNHYSPIQGNRHLNNLTEFIFLFSKGEGYDIDRLSIGTKYVDTNNIGRYNDINLHCGGNVWYINYDTIQSKEDKIHNDRFPLELPIKCIKLSGILEKDIVLDPFLGGGTTLEACMRTNRNCIGFEISNEWESYYVERLKLNHNKIRRMMVNG